MSRFLIEVSFRMRPSSKWFLVEGVGLYMGLAKATVADWVHCRTSEEWNFTASYDVAYQACSMHAEQVTCLRPQRAA